MSSLTVANLSILFETLLSKKFDLADYKRATFRLFLTCEALQGVVAGFDDDDAMTLDSDVLSHLCYLCQIAEAESMRGPDQMSYALKLESRC